MKWLLASAALGLVACGAQPPMPPSKATLLPLGYAANLLTMRECRYLGPVTNGPQADGLGANIVLVFVEESHETTYNMATTKSVFWSRGKAMSCPPQTLQTLLAPQGAEG